MNNIEYECGGLVCDNTKCDYRDDTIKAEDYKNWLNKPCPKCGENLLTEDDYKRFVALQKSIDFVNSLSPEELEKFKELTTQDNINIEGMENVKDEDKISISVSTHKDIKFKIEKED